MSKLVDQLRIDAKEAREREVFFGATALTLDSLEELLAHIERLEAEQAIACARCGGAATEADKGER